MFGVHRFELIRLTLSWNTKRGSRSDDTLDSGMGTPMVGRGIRGVDASTPLFRPNYQARPRYFGNYLTPIHDKPPPSSPTPKTQTEPLQVGPQWVTPWTGPLTVRAQLQSDIPKFKKGSPAQRNPAAETEPVRRRSRSLVEVLAGGSIDRCLTLSLSQMGGIMIQPPYSC